MTSMPASRSARAMIFAPRSWPSRPGLATTTRIFFPEDGAADIASFATDRPARSALDSTKARPGRARPLADRDLEVHPGVDGADELVRPGTCQTARDGARGPVRDAPEARPARARDVVRRLAGPAELHRV